MKIRTYHELLTLPTFEERFSYLQLNGQTAHETFGTDRYLNQTFYRSQEWRQLRNEIILRDAGCDLGIEGHDIYGRVLIHHMNPITQGDILEHSVALINPDFLICVSHNTHNAIHYGNQKSLVPHATVERRPNDTCPWRRCKL